MTMIIKLDDLNPSSFRWSYFSEQDAAVLRSSLNTYGQQYPVHVRRVPDAFSDGFKYETIDGHGRIDQARELGWACVDAVDHGEIDDAKALELSLTMNLARLSKDHFLLAKAFEQVAVDGLPRIQSMIPWDASEVESYVALAKYDWKQFVMMREPQKSFFIGDDTEEDA